jgi:hypothetical protein
VDKYISLSNDLFLNIPEADENSECGNGSEDVDSIGDNMQAKTSVQGAFATMMTGIDAEAEVHAPLEASVSDAVIVSSDAGIPCQPEV